MKINEWGKSVNNGKIGEEYVAKYVEILKPVCDQFLYSKRYEYDLEGKDKQKRGIDGDIKLHFTWDSKTRNTKYPDIFLETISKIDEGIPGWFFTSEVDVIIYLFLDKEKKPDDGYLILLKQAREYFTKEKLEKYPSIIAWTRVKGTNITWRTEGRPVPFEDFPEKSLIHILDKIKDIKENENKQQTLF